MKYGNEAKVEAHYIDIHMPKNTPIGFYIAGTSFILGFGLVWHIWWLAILASLGILCFLLLRSFDYDIDYYVSASEVARIESKHAHVN